MKTVNLFQVSLIGVTLLAGLSSCKKMEMDEYRDVSYNAAYVVNGESNTISIIDISSDQVRKTFKLGEASMGGNENMSEDIMWPHHFALNPANNQLAIGAPGMDLSAGHAGGMEGMAGMIAFVDANSGMITQTLELPAMNHNAIYSPNGKEVWSSQMNEEGKVLVFDASTLELKNTISVGMQPAEVTFSSDGKVAFVANGEDNTVSAIDRVSKTILATIPVGEDPVGAWPGSDGKMYVDNEEGKSISVIDVATLQVEEIIPLDFTPAYAALRPGNSAELWVTDTDNGKIDYFLKMNGTWMKHGSISTGAGAHAIAFSRDFKKAYITNQLASSVSVIDADTKKKQKDIAVGQKPNGIIIRYQ